MQLAFQTPLSSCVNRAFATSTRVFCGESHLFEEPLTRLHDLFHQNGCETIKSETKIRVLRMRLLIGQRVKPVYVKQHNTFFHHRLASLFYPSPALRSLRGAGIFWREGFSTARPVAAVEYRRWGVLIKSFYVTEEISGAKPVVDYWRENVAHLSGNEGRGVRQALLRKLALSFKSLHEKKIYHNDLKADNILARQERGAAEVALSFIDLQGVRKCFYVSKRRRIKNLAQINRSLGRYLSQKEKLAFLGAYMGAGRCDRNKKRKLAQSIVAETSRQMMREKSRHPKGANHSGLPDYNFFAIRRCS